MSWLVQLFSQQESSPPSKPGSVPPSIPEPLPPSKPKIVVCGLLGNDVDGAAGDKVTEDFIRWYHHLSTDPRYNAELSTWLAIRPFDYAVNGEDITLTRNPTAASPPAIATKTFIDRVRNIASHCLEKQDTLVIVLAGLEDDPTCIFLPESVHYRQDPRKHPHARVFLTTLRRAFIHHTPSDIVAPLALGSRMLDFLGSRLTFRASDSPPSFHNAMHDIPFLTQPSSEEIGVALLDVHTQKLYNTRWDTSDEEISHDELHACYSAMSNISDQMGPSLKYPIKRLFDGKMTKEEEAHFLDVYREFKRQRTAYRCMAKDLGLWKPPPEGEVMSADDAWMFDRVSLRLSIPDPVPGLTLDALGLDLNIILTQTQTVPPYVDPPMWLARRWVISGKPMILTEEWQAAAQRAADIELKYVGTHEFYAQM